MLLNHRPFEVGMAAHTIGVCRALGADDGHATKWRSVRWIMHYAESDVVTVTC